MLLLSSIALVLASPSGQTASLTMPQFVERLVDGHTALQMDRIDVAASKASPSSLRSLSAHAEDLRKLIAAAPEQDPKSALQKALSVFEENLKLIVRASDPKSKIKKECCKDDGFVAVLLAAIRTPGFAMAEISSPAQYNFSPLLYDIAQGPVYADASSPATTRVLMGKARKGAQMRTGDVIVAVRAGEDDPWESIVTWQDLLHASKDFESGKHVMVKFKRNRKVSEVSLLATPAVINGE